MMFHRLSLVAAIVAAAAAPGSLGILRVTPAGTARPDEAVTITFDRPVAGALDHTVDPSSIFGIQPETPGRVYWRDPITLVFEPARRLEPGAEYTVTVSNTFTAVDGSKLDGPFHFTFRVSMPRVLTGDPARSRTVASQLPALPTFRLLTDYPVSAGQVQPLVSVKMNASCGGATIGVRVLDVRPVRPQDPLVLRYTGLRTPMGDSADTRRVVVLQPDRPLPLDCAGALRVPGTLGGGTSDAWPIRTHGPLRVDSVTCGYGASCPTGPARIAFSTPVRGAALLRHLSMDPSVPVTLNDTDRVSTLWDLDATLAPRRPYTVTVAGGLTDIFGQRLGASAGGRIETTGYAPSVSYEYGKLLVERRSLASLAVEYVNVDTLTVRIAAVPDTLLDEVLATEWSWGNRLGALLKAAPVVRIPVRAALDRRRVTGIRMPEPDARQADAPKLFAVQIGAPALDTVKRHTPPIAMVQVTDLAVHARVGTDQGLVWVTGVEDGLPRAGARVFLYDRTGRQQATGVTGPEGLALLEGFGPPADCQDWQCRSFDGYVRAALGNDQAVVGLSAYDPDLSPWRFGLSRAYGRQREPVAAAVFTERGIYRPGDSLYAKTIVRTGTLGALHVPVGDSVRWVLQDRDGQTLEQAIVRLSRFGTADRRFGLPADLALGHYTVQIELYRDGEWQAYADATYQVAEYRPPEFLVDIAADTRPRLAGDTLRTDITGRYLFGAPMARAPVHWNVRRRPLSPWDLDIPGLDGFAVGIAPRWWDGDGEGGTQVLQTGSDSLDATGHLAVAVPLPAAKDGATAAVDLVATVTDANRQTVTEATSVQVHPAAFYIGARQEGDSWFWRAGRPVKLDVLVVRPDGQRVAGVSVTGSVVRREWHRVRRVRDGMVEEVGSWVSDTVADCSVQTQAQPTSCSFTPPGGGSYSVTLTARDDAGREAATRFYRWAGGTDWVPWNDESKLTMDVVTDRDRYAAGDTATLLLAAPFTDVEALVTVERERVLWSKRMRITAGATTLKLPITEAYAPNAFVSVVLVRGRSAPPGPLDDPGRPTLRVGYAELRVTPEVKRLTVDVRPEKGEYRPRDTASIAVDVHAGDGRGRRADVALWAVDEGVLALTGFRTPDPIALLYPPRGIAMRLASNLVSVAPQVPRGDKGRAPGGGGGGENAAVLRSRFRPTAFFLGSVTTDDNGHAVARAPLPDNLTTFRVMAVAVTDGDRYGSGDARMLVSLPLLARPALPRFARRGDRFRAGVVVNSRMPGSTRVRVQARAEGITIDGKKRQDTTLDGPRPAEVRFEFRDPAGDSARFRFDARGGGAADAVAVAVPVRPNDVARVRTVAGLVRDTAASAFMLDGRTNAARSTLTLSFGSSVLAVIQGAADRLRVYPYQCSEQVSSAAMPLIALYRVRDIDARVDSARVRGEIEKAVGVLLRRQTPDGGIGYWSASDWTTPWLSAYAGRVLLEARDAGIDVPAQALDTLAAYLSRSLHRPADPHVVVARWWDRPSRRLAERVAAVDLLSRLGRPDVGAENTLLQQAAQLAYEDRLLLAMALDRRGETAPARTLLGAALSQVRVEGRTAVLPDSTGSNYFPSHLRATARLLEALEQMEPHQALVGPLVERLVQQGRVVSGWRWTTQDVGWAMLALMRQAEQARAAGPAPFTLRVGGRVVLTTRVGPEARDTVLPLDRLRLTGGKDGRRLDIDVQTADSASVYWYLTLTEHADGPSTEPVDQGMAVERWYEDPTTAQPLVSVAEGQLVRVRLRVTVPAERNFVVLDDPLPAGLEPVDLSLRTVSPFGAYDAPYREMQSSGWVYGSWDAGMWSPFDHKEMRDDRVVFAATYLWKGVHTATYLARATTAGRFLYPPAHAEEMYNPGVNGRSAGGIFRVLQAKP